MRERISWSHSVLNSFETCPKRHYEIKVVKNFIEPEGEELKWGNLVHKALENYVKRGDPLPEQMKQYQGLVDQIKDSPGDTLAEQRYTLTKDFKPCDWFSPNAWVRCIVDVSKQRDNLFIPMDYKTGKPKPESDQLKLVAAMVFCAKPEVETVRSGFIWLKDNKVTTETYRRADLGELWSTFLPRVQRLEHAFAEDKWEPRPSGLCKKWCPVRSCSFHGKGG